jgi:pimeloyl-ACP methyl ester carboxylesterase
MMEHPIFVPFEGEHIAAVVTLPDTEPRSLALLVPGGGSPRSHKFRLWTRTARSLAERGIASARIDYPGLGQSTAPFTFSYENLPVPEVGAVFDAVGPACEVSTFAVVGNCLGARTGITMAARVPGCVGVACVLPNPTAILATGRVVSRPRATLRRSVRRLPLVRTAFSRTARTRGHPLRLRFMPELDLAANRVPLLFLLLGTEVQLARLERGLLAAGLSAESRERLSLETILTPGNILSFNLPLDVQQPVVDSLVDWLDATLPGHVDEKRLPTVRA